MAGSVGVVINLTKLLEDRQKLIFASGDDFALKWRS